MNEQNLYVPLSDEFDINDMSADTLIGFEIEILFPEEIEITERMNPIEF